MSLNSSKRWPCTAAAAEEAVGVMVAEGAVVEAEVAAKGKPEPLVIAWCSLLIGCVVVTADATAAMEIATVATATVSATRTAAEAVEAGAVEDTAEATAGGKAPLSCDIDLSVVSASEFGCVLYLRLIEFIYVPYATIIINVLYTAIVRHREG
jgi:hypothetical protein